MIRRLRIGLFLLTALGATLLVSAWGLGAVLSDRFAWSQWLAWIPTPVVCVVALLASLTALGAGRRRAALAAVILAAAAATLVVFVEHRPFASAPPVGTADPTPGLRLVHWTVAESLGDETKAHVVDVVTRLEADVVVLTNAGHIPRSPALDAWIGNGSPPLLASPFRVLSRRPVRTLRTLVANDGIAIALLVVESPTGTDGLLEILLVDLPSDPRRGRMVLATKAARLLASTGRTAPDIVVGDFNMTRGSAAVRHLFPDHRDAWHDAGRGIGASFPRRFPLYHTDHVLLADGVTCMDYRLPDGGAGRHRLQVADLRRTAPSPRDQR